MLFSFDPRRQAILLFGGDKTGKWNDWYEWAIPLADDLYDYLPQPTGERYCMNSASLNLEATEATEAAE